MPQTSIRRLSLARRPTANKNEALPGNALHLIAAVLNALEGAGCPATLVGACAVAARSGQYLRPVRDIDIYTRRESVAMHVLESAGLQRIAPSLSLIHI